MFVEEYINPEQYYSLGTVIQNEGIESAIKVIANVFSRLASNDVLYSDSNFFPEIKQHKETG